MTKLFDQWYGLVAHLMRKRFARVHDNDRDDMEQVGYFALWEATVRYDPKHSSGAAFQSFAYRWILCRMLEYYNRKMKRPKERTGGDMFFYPENKKHSGKRRGRFGREMIRNRDWTVKINEKIDTEDAIAVLDANLGGTRYYDVMKARAQGEKLTDIANRMGICKERVRQLHERGNEKAAALLRVRGMAA